MKTKTKSPRTVNIAVLVEGGIVQQVACDREFKLVVVDLDNAEDRAAAEAAWSKLARTHKFTS